MSPPAAAAAATGAHVCVLGAAHVAVLGAGVIGLTSAVQLLERLPGLRVTLLAEHFGADTTSYGAGGLWKPYALGSTPAALVARWGAATLEHYLRLHASPEAAPAGVMLTSAFQLWSGDAATPVPDWAGVVPHFRHLSAAEVARHGRAGVDTHGWSYTTVVTCVRAWAPLPRPGPAGQCEADRCCVYRFRSLFFGVAGVSPVRPADWMAS